MSTSVKYKIVPLSFDLMFKYIFGTNDNKKFTSDLLESLFDLEPGSFKDIEILNSVKLGRETILSKKFELDVLVKPPDGNEINLEMQRIYDENAEIKNTLYIFSKFSNFLKTGEKYDKLSKIFQVAFVKDNPLHNTDEIIKRYGIINYNNPNDIILENYFKIIIVDVDKEENIPYTKLNKRFELWRKLIGAETKEEMLEIAKVDSIFKEAVDTMTEFSSNDYVQDYTGKDRLIKSQIDSAKKEGIEEGIEQGKIEIARNMLKETDDLNFISSVTALSIDTINSLKDENKES